MLAYPYIFLLLFGVCFVIKVLLDKMVQYTVGEVSPQEGALDTKIWQRNIKNPGRKRPLFFTPVFSLFATYNFILDEKFRLVLLISLLPLSLI
jgi:hypothetical protein